MTKKTYIHPEIQFVRVELYATLLAGSGSGSAEAGGGKPGGGTSGGVTGGGGGFSDAKENQFSTWEDWDEY